ncbi:MAG: integrin alpha, partial [Armatimonadetes bacterium]|nr:integrin alpha [Armatimonadota bacterium]
GGANGATLWEVTISLIPDHRDRFGQSVSGLGDLNGDGVPDVVVGAPGVRGNQGRIYLLSGRNASELAHLHNPDNTDSEFGFSVSAGDGFIAIGAPLAD